MESLMSFSSLAEALGASLFAGEGKQDKGPFAGREGEVSKVLSSSGFSSVSIDSRTLRPGALFVALRGSSRDGHSFVDAAFNAGASGAIVALSALADPVLSLLKLRQRYNRVLIAVEDTLRGLQDAARVYLEQFSNLVKIGITGSTGKTTTKEIAAAIVGQEKSLVMNEGNMNSETGLPLSVFEVRPHHQVGIFEAGMNRPGEIAELAKVLNPRIALITNIGSAHIGILGSRNAIAEEKKKIFSGFSHENTALIPEDDEYRDFLAKDVCGRVVFYGASSLPALGAVKDLGLEGTEIVWEGQKLRFNLPGNFNLSNAFAAASLALELQVSAASIRRGLESVRPLFGRGEILTGRTTVIRDCYNSNPESAKKALDFCDSLQWPGRKIYVLGSMLELGDLSPEAHAALGRRLAECKAAMVLLFGDEIGPAGEVLKNYETRSITAEEEKILLESLTPGNALHASPQWLYFSTRDKGELSRALDKYVRDGDLVLLKGSRGCELETLTGMLLGEGHVS